MKNFKTIAVLVLAEKWLGMVDQKERLLADGVIMESAARDGSILVPTLEGNLTCRLNDYIVTDEQGKRTVVDAETFEAGYELADESDLEGMDVVEEVEETKKVDETAGDAKEETASKEVVDSPDLSPKGKKK